MKLLGISGSLRAKSYNTMLLAEAAWLFAPGEYTFANLRLPLFDEDLEVAEGTPEPVAILHRQIIAADAVIIATPEYNKNLTGVLKNALDWVSRSRPAAWAKKPVAIMSASTGATGGVRAQYSLRHCMTTFNPRILQAPEVMIANAAEMFDNKGTLTSERSVALLTKQMQALRDEIGRG